jgi:hypothetical protein
MFRAVCADGSRCFILSIPAFDLGGVLPPFLGTEPGVLASQSPYEASMLEIVHRLGTSAHRNQLLRGLLDYRAALRGIGLIEGFQWIDGSFVEDKELVRGLAPSDIDVVTLFERTGFENDEPGWRAHIAPHRFTLFNPRHCKATYRCDAYPIDLGTSGTNVARQSAFWFSLFSHQRDSFRWKGIIQCPLGPDGIDTDASDELARRGA